MITQFKIFEILNVSKLLCINNNLINQLGNEYDLTIGKLYDIDKYSTDNVIIIIVDDSGHKILFDPRLIYRNFSTDQSWEEYQINQATKKYNI